MTLTVLKSFDLTDDSFVTLKAQLDKVVSIFKIALVATINMFSSIDNTDAVKSKNVLLASLQQSRI